MAMTLRLTDEERDALREVADAEGISMQDAARKAVRDYVATHEHRTRVAQATTHVMREHADALDRLGQ
jgi:predicted transcriptional regulator